MFIGMVTTAMTDEKPPIISRVFYWTLKYLLGFPMVLFNNQYPFFLDSSRMPTMAIFLVIFNNIILAFLIWSIRKVLR
jgi:hypothetical protein